MSLFAKWLKFNTETEFQSQTQSPSSSRATRRSSVAASVVWEALKRKGAQRGSPKAASLSRLCCRSKIPIRNRRTSSELAENAAKELKSLSEYMPISKPGR